MTTARFAQLLTSAETERSKSRFKQARALFLQAAGQAPEPEATAQALQGAADCARLLGDFPASLKAYSQSLKLVPSANAAFRADLLAGEALAWRAAGKPKQALAGLKRALAAYSKLKDTTGQAFSHWALGGTYRIAGDLSLALKHLSLAERAYAKLQDAEGSSYVACALGGVNRMLGRWDESLRHYHRANAAMRKRGDTFGTAYSYCGLGNAARMHGDVATALAYFKQAEKVYATIGDKVSYAYTLWSMATAYKLQGKFAPAKAAFAKAERLFKLTGDERGRAYIELGYAELAFLQKRSAKAALARAAKLAKPFAWESRHVKALGALVAGQAWKAQDAYKGSGSRFDAGYLPVNWP